MGTVQAGQPNSHLTEAPRVRHSLQHDHSSVLDGHGHLLLLGVGKSEALSIATVRLLIVHICSWL